jgi:DNA-directed RNA polymerase subunit K/omega
MAEGASQRSPWENRLTKYEVCKVLATRTEQIAEGGATTLTQDDLAGEALSSYGKALREVVLGKCPLLIVRSDPGRKPVTLRVREMVVPADLLVHAQGLAL